MPLDKQFIRENKYIRIGLFVMFLVSVASLFPRSKLSTLNFEVGTAWYHQDLVAPFAFAIQKNKSDYEREQEKARQNVLPVFRREHQERLSSAYSDTFNLIADSLKFLLSTRKLDLRNAEQLNMLSPFRLNEKEMRLLLANFDTCLAQNKVQKSLLLELPQMLQPSIRSLLSDGMINVAKGSFSNAEFLIRSQNEREEKVLNFSTVRDSAEFRATLQEVLLQRFHSPTNDTLQLALKLVSPFLRPNIFYDEAQTLEDRARVSAQVPIGEGIVRQNEKIISRGEIITPDIKRKLDSFIQAKMEREMPAGALQLYIGKILIIFIIIGVFTTYLYIARPKIWHDNAMLLLLFSITLIELVAVWYSLQFENLSPYIVPIGLASILFTVIFDSRVGFFATVTVALLAGTIRGNDFPFALATIFAGSLGVFATRGIRKRSQVFAPVLLVFVGYAVSILAFNFSRLASLNEILNDLLYAAMSSLLCFLVYPILLLIEKVFGITTDMTLMELSDLNHPLLREMATKAPGTYSHTMQVSLLAEEAATAIGANPLLCRVGAYFHDIGKTTEADYFTENQNGKNLHDHLQAVTSGRIIADHVKRGLVIGRQHKLPEEVIDFIPEHHGTTVIHFFYDKALKTLPPEKINIEDFRYPGPKPRRKETAIVMLADGVEASVRSLTNPTEETISQIIDVVVRKRLDENQFNESDLTFSDLESIKQSFIKTLVANKHKRIKYPGQKI
jgi:putative nucleotidyltransferase with HDIG domain